MWFTKKKRRQEEQPPAPPAVIDLATAYICFTCNKILAGAPHGECLLCGAKGIQSVSRMIQGYQEREEWLKRFNRQLAALSEIRRRQRINLSVIQRGKDWNEPNPAA